MAIKRIKAVVRGRVQGVGFRYFTRDRALCHNITGWVRNAPDGNVEFEAQGAAGDINTVVAEIRKGPGLSPGLSRVSDLTINELPLEVHEKGFEIRI